MVIGIIGASISGLIAGKLLAQAGHNVTIFEKGEKFGGRLATKYIGNDNEHQLDYGAPYLEVATPDFRDFAMELSEKGHLQPWGGDFRFFDGEGLLDQNPNGLSNPVVTSQDGMDSIGKYLSRWVDIRLNTKVGGITHIGNNRKKKRSWMITLTSREVIGADAILIALPAPQAYGILASTIDETNTLKIVREIDEIAYSKTYSLSVGYGDQEIPDWQGIACNSKILEFISNEGLKRGRKQGSQFVLHSTDEFAQKHARSTNDRIVKEMLSEFARITSGWATSPEWQDLDLWRFKAPFKTINRPYFELEEEDSPLALVGDYFEGAGAAFAYQSGKRLAEHWIERFKK